MAEQNVINGAAGFKEAVCIDAGRVYDSCSEIHFTPLNQKPLSFPKGAFLCYLITLFAACQSLHRNMYYSVGDASVFAAQALPRLP